MLCPSCDAEANTCDWCVSYSDLIGATVQLGAGPVAAAGDDTETLLRFLAEFAAPPPEASPAA